MQRIPSFCIDHTRLEKGVYLSRQDDDVLTWDVRIKRPNQGDYLAVPALHTMEHLFATYARNSEWKDGVIYIGPMGCRTGMYFLTRGLSNDQVLVQLQHQLDFLLYDATFFLLIHLIHFDHHPCLPCPLDPLV